MINKNSSFRLTEDTRYKLEQLAIYLQQTKTAVVNNLIQSEYNYQRLSITQQVVEFSARTNRPSKYRQHTIK